MMRLIEIINEEIVKSFGNVEYGDEDIVNPDDIDLRGEYNKLNAILFDDELPEVPLEWGIRKHALGHVTATINKRTGQINIKGLTMSKFRALPYRTFLNVLAHEMIHVKLFSKNYFNKYDHHDHMFMSEARRINLMGLGFNITKRNDEDLSASELVKKSAKDLIAVMIKTNRGNFINVTTPTVFGNDSEKENIINIFKFAIRRGIYRNVEIIAVESRNPDLLTFPIQRTYRTRLRSNTLSDRLYNELMNDKIIFQEKLGDVKEEQGGEWEEIIVS